MSKKNLVDLDLEAVGDCGKMKVTFESRGGDGKAELTYPHVTYLCIMSRIEPDGRVVKEGWFLRYVQPSGIIVESEIPYDFWCIESVEVE